MALCAQVGLGRVSLAQAISVRPPPARAVCAELRTGRARQGRATTKGFFPGINFEASTESATYPRLSYRSTEGPPLALAPSIRGKYEDVYALRISSHSLLRLRWTVVRGPIATAIEITSYDERSDSPILDRVSIIHCAYSRSRCEVRDARSDAYRFHPASSHSDNEIGMTEHRVFS